MYYVLQPEIKLSYLILFNMIIIYQIKTLEHVCFLKVTKSMFIIVT